MLLHVERCKLLGKITLTINNKIYVTSMQNAELYKFVLFVRRKK